MFKIGDTINYHAIIGGEITSKNHKIIGIKYMPNNFGCDVAWITEKSGCVCLDALSNEENPMKPYQKPLSKNKQKSKKKYKNFIDSEYNGTFAEYMGFKKISL